MKLYIKLSVLMLAIACLIFSCNEQDISPEKENFSIEDLSIPDGFQFRTSKNLDLKITDIEKKKSIVYKVYFLNDSQQKHLIASGATNKGVLNLNLTIPIALEYLRIERIFNGLTNVSKIFLSGNTLNFEYDGSNNEGSKLRSKNSSISRSGCYETLYAVNGNGQFFTINNESGNYEETQMSNLVGGGSIACAVDRTNRKMYYNTNTTLRYFDIDAASFHVVAEGNPFNSSYPRMEYNNTNGLLYIARDEKMYIINPSNNNIETTYDIIGLQSPVSGGDMAISLDGTVYMCAFSGLYRISFEGANAIANRISAENLPFSPTSMAIDRNDRLYLATNSANSQLIEMDKFDGAWAVVKTYSHKINDLGSLPCTQDELDQTDSDGDGIINVNDKYPNDPNKAFEVFTPSELGWGSLGFEDNWPAKGDYDFNDLVIAYRVTSITNSQNEVVTLKMKYRIKALNGVFQNGFGCELPISPSLITEVTGHRLTKQIPTLDDKGLEFGQSKAVIIVFDNAHDLATPWTCSNGQNNEIEIIVNFTTPISPSVLGNAPFNPFIFINGERGREIHLKDKTPTELATNNYFGTADDRSDEQSDSYYKTDIKLPWAINIIHDFKAPLEGIQIINGYNHFSNWAEQGGNVYTDWYKDNSGYRNVDKLCGE